MEDKIYTTDELIDMDVYTSDFEFMHYINFQNNH